jgi:hypothetical protein
MLWLQEKNLKHANMKKKVGKKIYPFESNSSTVLNKSTPICHREDLSPIICPYSAGSAAANSASVRNPLST